jgi:ABC-type thiamin/hydroxymethylpyrimidine transport system permease subunit
VKAKNNSDYTDDVSSRAPYYFETADLVIIALFAALGGISSSFIGTITRSIFQPLGLPGFGQIVAGIHIFWYILVFLLTDRKIGAVTLTGMIKGCVELFAGSSLGIIAFLISLTGAFIFEIIYFALKFAVISSKIHTHGISIAGGFASASNVLIQVETFLQMSSKNNFPSEWVFIIFLLAFISGVGFGYLGLLFHYEFEKTGILSWRKSVE